MYGNSSLMTDKDITFFGDQDFSMKDSMLSGKDCTKNSSNPEKIYKELNSEITKAREGNISSNSRNNNEITLNDHFIDPRIWSNNNNESQDSNQYLKKYELLRKKEKGAATPKNKGKNKNIFIVNNNYDYSQDTEEFGMSNIQEEDDENLSIAVNRISSINIKNNNIDQLDKNSTTNMNTSKGTPINKKMQIHCVTEPDEFNGSRPYFSNSFHNNGNLNNQFMKNTATPQKMFRDDNRSMNMFMFNNSIQNPMNFTNANNYDNVNNMVNTAPCFPQLINRSSMISNRSTHYSSNNKKKHEYVFEEGESVEYNDGISVNEENYINLNFMTENNVNRGCSNMNMYYQSMSDKKVRLPTSESIESNNSAQFNYLRNHPKNLIGMNLNPQFSSNGNNVPFYFDEETRRDLSSSFNDTNYIVHPSNFENAFSINNNFVNNNTIQAPSEQLIESKASRQKVNKHTKSENIYKIKIGTEKNVLNLDEILQGKDKRTTLMIRNIPIKYSDDMLVKELEEFKGKFDCLYLPYDYEKNGNRGYAFINFVHPFHILLFYEKFEGKTWNFFESKKICELNSAKFQGINEIKRHARNYKGQKKPSFFIVLDNLSNLELPMKYRNQLKNLYPNITFEEGTSYGVVKIKSLVNKLNCCK